MVKTARIEEPIGKSNPLPDLSVTATNGPDREEFLFMVGQIAKADEGMESARKHRKTIRSQAKLRGFELEQMDRAIEERNRDDNTTVEGLKVFKRYCEFLNLPIGSQISLFDAPQSNGFSQETILKHAYDDGYERGIMGKNPDDQAYPGMSEEGQSHLAGWNAGQAVNLAKFTKLSDDLNAAEAKKVAKKLKADADDEPVLN